MPRWRLKQPHYLNVPDTEWEHTETARDTGKRKRTLFKVPRFLHPEDPNDHTHKELESIIVCHAPQTDPRDLLFEGDPTPDMEPLDAEAKKLSDEANAKRVMPMSEDALPGTGYGQMRLDGFLKELAAITASQKPTSITGVSVEDFKALQERVEALAAENAKLKATPEAEASRRV